MTCTWDEAQYFCHTNKHYCNVKGYHGELCFNLYETCQHWEDSPEDAAFKIKMRKFYEESKNISFNKDESM